MKTRLVILLTAIPALAVVNPTFGQVSVSGGVQINVPSVQITPPSVQINAPGVGLQIGAVGDFYGPLTPYGSWINFQSYGRCWHPTQVAADWQPYTDGSWEYTDSGWYFNSDEPWGWATCHYGSWANDPSIGWVWIPGTDWAPAWVTWRTSDNYIGWAPCGPNMSVLAPSLFVFVGVHNFGGVFTPGANVFIRNDRTIINQTRVINGFNRRTVNFDGHQRTIFANTGPNVRTIQRATGRQFTARPVTDVVRESKSRAPENLRGNENRAPQEQRYNNQQRPNENFNRETTPPPTGREQQRNYYNNENQNRLNQEQQRNNIENQNRMNEQQQRQEQRAMPPTGGEEQRNYNNEEQNRLNQQQRQREQQRTAPTERNQPAAGREVTPPSQQREVRPSQTPTERTTPSERATPQERNLAPTGREDAPSSERQQQARPSQGPAQRAPAQAPGQEKKDNKDQ